MPLHLANRVKETSISSGSGIIILGGAPATYQPFSSALSDGDTTYYTVVDNSNWEVGIGTYSANTLSRDIILSSSNSNNKINLGGSSNVFIAYPSEKSVYKDQNNQLVAGNSGIIIQSGIPSNVTNVLYNIGSELYFNGYPLRVDPANEAYALITTIFNESQTPIPKFTAVYISGSHGDLPTVNYAIANTEAKSSKTYGVTQETIPAMSSGHVVIYGNISGLNTDQFNPNAPQGDINGQVLYLSPTISGGFTTSKPYAPYHLVSLGTVIRTHQTQGIFNVRIQNGFEMEELHNVATTGAVSGQFIKYDGSLWRNTNIVSSDIADFSSAVSGISPNISISGASGIAVDKNGNAYTVYATGNFGLSSSQVQSLLNSGVSIYVTGGTGNFSSLSVNGTGVSLSGHVHTSSQITDFNTSVSGLINVKNINGSGYATVTSSGGVFTVAVTGLQPSGNYSLTGHTHIVSDITNFSSGVSGLLVPYALLSSGNFTNLYVTGVPVSTSGHTHTVSQITNFNSGVSGLLPSVSGSGYATVVSGNNIYIVSVTGLQPSGNYSLAGHTHTSSNITDFNTSVSGLLTPYALLNSPNFSGVPTAPTAASGTNTTQLATTQFVRTEISNLVSSAPSTLDTLNELAAALGNDPNFATTVTNSLANKANLSGAAFSGLITAPSGDFVVLKQNGIVVSVSGHTHTASNVTDFNSAVSGILPVKNINGSGYVVVSSSGGVFTIYATGLQPSGNYSFVGHTHVVSDITNFNSGVSGLLTPYALLNSGNFNALYVTGTPVSTSGHTHTSSQITNFNSSVSGLLSVTNIIGTSGISVTSSGTVFTIASTGTSGGGATINNPGSGRLIMSDGTSNGLVAQTGLTFDGRSVFLNGVNIKNGQNLYMWANFR